MARPSPSPPAACYINPQNGIKINSYGDLWDERFRKRYLMITPKFTQSIYMLIATASMVTGKPLKDAQYETDEPGTS